jgi:hypothetical protein
MLAEPLRQETTQHTQLIFVNRSDKS